MYLVYTMRALSTSAVIFSASIANARTCCAKIFENRTTFSSILIPISENTPARRFINWEDVVMRLPVVVAIVDVAKSSGRSPSAVEVDVVAVVSTVEVEVMILTADSVDVAVEVAKKSSPPSTSSRRERRLSFSCTAAMVNVVSL